MNLPNSPEPLIISHADETVLHLPLADLVQAQGKALQETELLQRAARSGLYKAKWSASRIQPSELHGLEGLCRLPFIDADDILKINATRRGFQEALLAQPLTWLTSPGKNGPRKWLPLSMQDLAHCFARIRRAYELLDPGIPEVDPYIPAPPLAKDPSTVVLAINQPMPHVSCVVPYLWERVDCLVGRQALEFIFASMEMLPRNHWDNFAAQKRPKWLMASVENALALAKARSGHGNTPPYPTLRRGIFWGSPLDGPAGKRQELADAYGLEEVYSLYFSVECREMYVQCALSDGLHLWMDGLIHEIIPEGKQPVPEAAIRIDQAPAGMRGEYVVTTFSEALPLIRYRTGDWIEVISSEPCPCGLTHPRVRFTGRKG